MAASNAEAQLAEDMASFYDDPLGWVMYAYPWDSDPALQVCRLQEPYRSRFNCEYGPDVWACQQLDAISLDVKNRAFDGQHAVDPIRVAVSSGHGIGKSAFTAWLVGWITSTRPFCKGVVTANTAAQLSSKTWAEIAKWNKRSIVGHWFKVRTGKGAMKLEHVTHPESWRVDAQTCSEENSEAFAGLHAANSTPFYIFDEASAVPEAIWKVAEGGLTDGEPMLYAFGNPTRNTGAFFEAFHRMKHRWRTVQIDSRSVQITNKTLIDDWASDYGEDSDFFRVRVRGVFPRASSLQFIPTDRVEDAMRRKLEYDAVARHAAVGVDVARFGDDQTVIRTRVGRDGCYPKLAWRNLDTQQVASRVAEHINSLRSQGLRVTVFIDGGGVGGGVVDALRVQGYVVTEVQFAGKADDPKRYANKRAEMWGRLSEWLKVGSLDYDAELLTDLTSLEYGFKGEALLLESKDSMKKRGLASPDDGDALALTFAYPVSDVVDVPLPNHVKRHDYDPMALV